MGVARGKGQNASSFRIVVVGAGASGLSTAGALKRLGFEPLILDRDAAIGSSWRRRYDRLHLHTIRAFSGLAHFPIPRRLPRYLSRDMYAQYLELYARRLGLAVEHDCEVRAIKVNQPHAEGQPKFLIDTTKGDRYADALVVATGMYRVPVVPKFPGLDQYGGTAIHSSGYVSGRQFAGKRVLVIGLGNTGAEIAADLVENGASFVAASIRTTPAIVPRDFLATPVQLFGIALSRLPARLADRIGAAVSRIALGDLTRYGLEPPGWLPFSARRIPVIDVGFVSALKRGKIAIRSTVDRFTPTGVVYQDGSNDDVDAVIFATGFRTGLEHLLEPSGLLDENGYPKFASGERTPVPGLYFMGFFESHRGLLFEIEIASRRLARTIAADLGFR